MLRDFCRPEDRRPRHHPHAHDSGTADHHAGLRAARRHPFGGVRRIQRRSLRPARRRFRQPRADLRRRLLPQRQAGWITKASADIAVETAEKEGQHIDKVLVWRRYPRQDTLPKRP